MIPLGTSASNFVCLLADVGGVCFTDSLWHYVVQRWPIHASRGPLRFSGLAQDKRRVAAYLLFSSLPTSWALCEISRKLTPSLPLNSGPRLARFAEGISRTYGSVSAHFFLRSLTTPTTASNRLDGSLTTPTYMIPTPMSGFPALQ
jgi:hypothetical protein